MPAEDFRLATATECRLCYNIDLEAGSFKEKPLHPALPLLKTDLQLRSVQPPPTFVPLSTRATSPLFRPRRFTQGVRYKSCSSRRLLKGRYGNVESFCWD